MRKYSLGEAERAAYKINGKLQQSEV